MTSTRTIDALLEIMNDPDIVSHLRIDAAEQLLGFEAPDDVITKARDFLIKVFENKEVPITARMDALKIARKAEAAKVTQKIIRLEVKGRTEADRREEWQRYETVQLRMKICQATGNTPTQDSHPGWDRLLKSDDYLPPPGDEWPPWSKKAR